MPIDRSWLTFQAFQKIGYRHHHGINIILSSLKTKNSSGIGEFYDLIPLIDWCKEVGFDVIQLLPLNDTGNQPSPYMALTSCGLNPIFLSLWKLSNNLHQFEKFEKYPHVAYQEVLEEKMVFLREYYANFTPQRDYQQFLENTPWLESYALFRAPEDADFFRFLQYLCFIQLKEVKSYAAKKGVLLKGDIPILISEHSADVWSLPESFNTQFVAGAPPDQYSPDGQYWGFPLYRWEEMQKNGFLWWKRRLQYAANFYDMYRLDHIIGFFRIWAIPHGKKATEGFFLPEDPAIQEVQGASILTHLLSETSMLPIGEDLGVNLEIAQRNMKKLGIPGTKVVRWMRHYETDRSFIPYDAYPELSLTMLSTHDSEPLAAWWKNETEEAKAFCAFRESAYSPLLDKVTRFQILKEAHHTSSLFHINLLGEYLALFDELVWGNPEEERINVPGLILPTNWTYRLRPSLEQILAHKELKKAIQAILSQN